MSTLGDAVSYEFTWHTFSMEPCERCRELDGQTWTQSKLEGLLISPITGEEIWDLDADVSLMHPNCYCYLEVNPWIDLEKTPLWQDTQLLFMEAGQEVPSNIEETKASLHDLDLAYDITYKEIRQLESILFRTISMMKRFGIGEGAERAIMQIMRLISALRMLQRSIWLIEAGSGPLGLALAGIGFVAAGASGLTALEMS